MSDAVAERSTAYYRAQEVSEADLVLMRRIDALHVEHPFAGSRMLHDMPRWDGHSIGRSVRVRQRSTIVAIEPGDIRAGKAEWKKRNHRPRNC
jgi:hypothetical protein